ncbi:hypothetical protein BYT27DRAFT_7192821, partial [Phlegmacium glaucopus]
VNGKIPFYWWVFHFVPFLIMGRITYLHHYYCSCPNSYQHFTLRLMLSHVLDHFIFSSKQYTKKTKNIVFSVLASIIGLFSESLDLPQNTRDYNGGSPECLFLKLVLIFLVMEHL